MTTYTAIFAHSDGDTPGRMELDATTDDAAKAEVKAFVASGVRNGTWCNVELSDGRTFGARNKHGDAHSGISDAA